MQKELYLFRHGETDWNKEKRCQGQITCPEIPLNENGLKQAMQLSEFLKDKNLEFILSSDLLRAKMTAETIAKKHNIKLAFDERLRETNFGDMQGLIIKEIEEKWPNFRESYTNHTLPFPGGETVNDLKTRMKESIQATCHNHEAKVIGISSHGSIIGHFVASIKNAERKRMQNCTVVHITYNTDDHTFKYIETYEDHIGE
jgi:broad specificity phosphatase PhoE